MPAETLRDLAIRMGTDKEGAHAYTAAYERHLGSLRTEPITLLEIGIGGYADPVAGGASLRMWKAYFPAAHIVGLDVHDKSALAEERITILQGSQADASLLDEIGRTHGPFDVVIDDGSHHCKHVIGSFRALFPHVRDGGWYVVEDLQTSYWESYGGSSGPDRSGTTMTMLMALVDGLNHAEYDIPGYQPTETDRGVRSIAFYHNIAFIEKGANTEPSSLLPPHPRDRQHFARPATPPARGRRGAGRTNPLRRRFRRLLRRLAGRR